MKVAFAGTPEFAATILRGLLASPHEVGLVVSQPDARRGRGRKRRTTPVAELALDLGIPLRQPAVVAEATAEISENDALVVAAYGQILRPDTLYAAREGAYNVHASLLPKYRGAAPIERSIMAGERETGVTVIQMDRGLDTGPIALQLPTELPPQATGGELTGLLAHLGAKAMVEVLDSVEAGTVNLVEQDNLCATYAAKLTVEELEIGWELEAKRVVDLIRALAPDLGARTFHPQFAGPVKVWRARLSEGEDPFPEPGAIRLKTGRLFVGCGSGAIEVLELQAPGARRLAARDFLLGNPLSGAFG